jgi:Uri superfamily endonuclease
MRGTYILLCELEEEKEISVGKLGKIKFERGYYAYVGSGDESRIKRHLSKEKKMHWHIDYLLEEAVIREVLLAEHEGECDVANRFTLPYIKGFGCSDCRCKSHLFFSNDVDKIKKGVKMKPYLGLNIPTSNSKRCLQPQQQK